MRLNLKNNFEDGLWRLSFSGIIIVGFTVASIAPYRSIIGIERLGLSAPEFAIITAISAVITALSSIVIGIFSDQTGRYKDVLLGSLAMGCAGNALLFIVQTKLMFIIAMIMFLPIAGTSVSQFFALAKLAVNRNPRIDGDVSAATIRASFAGAYAVTPPVWALLILNGTDLMAIFGASASACLVMSLVVYAKWPNSENSQTQKATRTGFRQALSELSNRALAIRLVLITIAGSLTNLNSTLVGLIILNDLGGTESNVGWFVGGVALCEIPIMLFTTSWLKFMTKPMLITLGVSIFACYLSAFQFMSSTQYLWCLIIPASVGGGIFIALVTGYVQDLVSDMPGTGGALISIANIGGHMFTALIFGICASFASYSKTAAIGATCAVMASVLLVFLKGAHLQKNTQVPKR